MPSQAPPSAQQAGLQLNDIHLPEQINNFPVAIGWWLLIILIVVTIVWLIKKNNRKKALNQSKNHALNQLKNQSTLSDQELISLLKWGAMQYFNRQQIANLHGDKFQRFLQDMLPEKHKNDFSQLSKQAFDNQYSGLTSEQSNIDCKKAAKLWLTYALPPINKKSKSKEVLTHD